MKFIFVKIMVISLIVVLTIKCQNDKQFLYVSSLSLLYIEDIDGKDGLGMGDFGDIVLYDLADSVQYNITEDSYLNEYPSYSRLNNSIYFGSLRANQTITGISSEMNIFYKNLSSNKFIQVDNKDFYSKRKFSGLNHSYKPLICNNGKLLAFETMSIESSEDLIGVYNIVHDSLVAAIGRIRIIYSMTWDSRDTRIVFTSSYNFSNSPDNNYIGLFDIEAKTYVELLSRDYEWLLASDILGDSLLLIKKDLKTQKHYFEIVDMLSKETKYIIEISSIGFEEVKTPKFITENEIVFIGVNGIYDEYPQNDIYKLNIKTNRVERITNNGYIKDHLSVIQP